MLRLALNHMTVARLGFRQMVDLAAGLGCVGIEARNAFFSKKAMYALIVE